MRSTALLLIVFTFLSCNETKKTDPKAVPIKKTISVEKTRYPVALVKIFEAHGGLEKWKAQKTLSFIKPNDEGFEHYTIDLRTRKEKVVSETLERGFDGETVWLLDPQNNFKGDAIFYNNLYFYAMPFVIADEGINYSETADLVIDGTSYSGIKISYNEGVGASPKDEYFIHFNPKSNEMAWLGYTVTYRTGEKSGKINWIHYDDWQLVSGLKLPKSITWHKIKNGKIKGVEHKVVFEKIELSDKSLESDYYAKPESAKVIFGKQQ